MLSVVWAANYFLVVSGLTPGIPGAALLLFNFMAIKCYNQTNSSPRWQSLPLHTITNVLHQLQPLPVFLSGLLTL